MKITLECDEQRHKCSLPYENATAVDVADQVCAGCKKPLRVNSAEQRIEDNTYVGQAKCVECGHKAGLLRVEVPTLFGLEEDERIARGPWKKY